MKMVMFTDGEQQILADWWGSQPNVSEEVLSVIEKVVNAPPDCEVLQVWTADDVELTYNSVRAVFEDDYQTGGSEEPSPPLWAELTDAERSDLVEAGRKALEHTAPTSEALYDAVEDAVKEGASSGALTWM